MTLLKLVLGKTTKISTGTSCGTLSWVKTTVEPSTTCWTLFWEETLKIGKNWNVNGLLDENRDRLHFHQGFVAGCCPRE